MTPRSTRVLKVYLLDTNHCSRIILGYCLSSERSRSRIPIAINLIVEIDVYGTELGTTGVGLTHFTIRLFVWVRTALL